MRKQLTDISQFETIITIRCSHAEVPDIVSRHRVGITTRGGFAFFNHMPQELRLEDNLRQQADMGAACTCADIYRRWIRRTKRRQSYSYDSKLPEALEETYESLVASKPADRAKLAKIVDPLALSFHRRWAARVHPIALSHLKNTNYRQGEKHSWIVGVTSGKYAEVDSVTEREWDKYNEKSIPVTTVSVSVKPGWYSKVYTKGLALIDGMLVLDVLGHRRDGLLELLVAKQSRGFRVVAKGALWNGRKLRWL